jgi:hypothetical protein
MKPLRGPADIHTDDDRTQLALIHTDSSGRKDSRYIYIVPTPHTARLQDLTPKSTEHSYRLPVRDT